MNLFKPKTKPIEPTATKQPAQSSAPALPPMPRPLPAAASNVELEQYEAVAAKIGFMPQELRDERALRLLASIDVPVYDYDKVHAYMDAQVAKLRPVVSSDGLGSLASFHASLLWSWRWKPLRDADAHVEANGTSERGYSMPVPLRVLERVAAVLDVAPTARFWVSLIESRPKGDPFLAVMIDKSKFIVIDQWDEPGFTG